MAHIDWDYFDRFDSIINAYMPPRGEGETMASQTATAVNKLIYMFFNNGDIFDNTTGWVRGYGNDISDYANWLYDNIPEAQMPLNTIYACRCDDDYAVLLKNLADTVLRFDILERLNTCEKVGSIYDAEGKFRLEEAEDEEDYDDLEDDED